VSSIYIYIFTYVCAHVVIVKQHRAIFYCINQTLSMHVVYVVCMYSGAYNNTINTIEIPSKLNLGACFSSFFVLA
jgi:hypothetical protein